MTKYRLEFFRKGSGMPYTTEDAELPNGILPRFTNTIEALNHRIEK